MGKEELKPMPELKSAYKKPEPGVEGPPIVPIVILESLLQRYEKAIEKSKATLNVVGTEKGPARLNPEQYNPEQFHPEQFDPQKALEKAMEEIKVPEKDIDAFIEAGFQRERIRDEIQTKRDEEERKKIEAEKNRRRTKKEALVAKAYYAIETSLLLEEKAATIKKLIEKENKRSKIEALRDVYLEEELKIAEQALSLEIEELTREPKIILSKKPEKEDEEKARIESPDAETIEIFMIGREKVQRVTGKEQDILEQIYEAYKKRKGISATPLVNAVWIQEDMPIEVKKNRLSAILPGLKRKVVEQTTFYIRSTKKGKEEVIYSLEKKGGKKKNNSRKTGEENSRENPDDQESKSKERQKSPAKTQEEGKSEFTEVTESRRKAIEAIIDNPDLSLDELKDILGPSKKGRPLTWMQALYALTRASNILYIRIDRKIERFHENVIWNKIRSYVKNGDPIHKGDKKVILNSFKEKLKEWFKDRKSKVVEPIAEPEQAETAVKEIEIKPLTDHETMMLAGLTEIINIELDNVTSKTCKNFVYGILQLDSEFTKRLSLERYKNLRKRVLRKVYSLQGETRDEFVDMQYTDAETILTGLCCGDKDRVPELIDYLSSDNEDSNLEEEMNKMIRVWKKWEAEVTGVNLREAKEIEKAKPKATTIFTSDNDQSEETVTAFEQQNEGVRDKINAILDTMEAITPLETFKYGQVSLFLPKNIASSFAQKAIENEYITPEKGPDHHPIYRKWEIAVLRYLWSRQYSGGVNKGHIPALHKIVQEEIAKREEIKRKEKEQSNGKSSNGNGKNT